jgi:aminotransferase
MAKSVQSGFAIGHFTLTGGIPALKNCLCQRVQDIAPSGIQKFLDIINSMPDVLSLGVGEPDFVTPEHIWRAAFDACAAGQTKYSPNAGLQELRELLSLNLERLYGLRYDPDTELLIAVGVSEGLQDALIATLDPGDEVIVPEPCFMAYPANVIFAGGVPVSVPTYYEHDFAVTARDIAVRLTPRTRSILLGYPSNPTGAVMPLDELERVAQLAQERDLLVYSDEIYDRLVYGVKHTCVASLPGMRERTILLGGFSKAYAMTGWRVGYVAAPASLLHGIFKVHQYVTMCAPTPGQYAAIEALRNGEADVTSMVAEYDRRRRVIVDGLNKLGLATFEPHGAFYCFPRVKDTGMTSEEFAERLLLEEKVAVVPGEAFGACGAGHVRVCYTASVERLEEALVRIERFLKRHA